MPAFACTFDTSALPAEIRRGSTVSVPITATASGAPISSVMISADGYGITQHLQKQSQDSFLLVITIPFFVPPGSYRYSIWAVSEEGERSTKQSLQVIIK